MRLVSCLAVQCNPSRINTGSRRHLGSWAGFINCVEKTRRSSMESQSDVPLLLKLPRPPPEKRGGGKIQFQGRLAREVWEESKKLGEVVGPAVFMNLVFSSMNLVSQSFAGHLGDLDLAAFSIANTVVDGFNFAMLVGAYRLQTLLLLPSYICSLVVMCEIEIYPPLTSTTPASNEGIGFSGQSMLFFLG